MSVKVITNSLDDARLKLLACTVHTFLGAFAKLRKATVSFVMYVRPPVTRLPTGRIFMKFYI